MNSKLPQEIKGNLMERLLVPDPQTNVAVSKIEGKNLPSAKIRRFRHDSGWSMGNCHRKPFGLSQTVSVGVISAAGRNIGVAQYEDMIQTDAAINLAMAADRSSTYEERLLVLIPLYLPSGGYQGIGFAIPVNMVKTIMKDLVEKGKVTRDWLGVVIRDITPDLAKSFNVTVTEGVLASEIQENSRPKRPV